MPQEIDRRPIGARNASWAKSLTSILVRANIEPNQISIASVVFAAIGGALYYHVGTSTDSGTGFLIAAALCIPMRLLCNMLDGMVAVEGGKQSKTGALFNELPDRMADCFFLVGAGFAAKTGQVGIQLGWAASLLAVLTAYIRAFGASQGLKQNFCGPMAKPQRMWLLAAASIGSAVEEATCSPPRVMTIALAIIAIGSMATCLRRTLDIQKGLVQR